MAISKNADTEKVTCKVEKVKDEEMPPPYVCTFLPIAKTGSGVLVQDTNVPADEDLELVFSYYYSLSSEERAQGIPFTRLVDESGSKKRAQRIRNIANFEAELAARNLRLATRGSTNAYYLESVSSIPEMAS
jgi:hypothetical protein